MYTSHRAADWKGNWKGDWKGTCVCYDGFAGDFCKGNCGTCGERVPPYGEAAVCEKCGVASYCDADCMAEDAVAHSLICADCKILGREQIRADMLDDDGNVVAKGSIAILYDGKPEGGPGFHVCGEFREANASKAWHAAAADNDVEALATLLDEGLAVDHVSALTGKAPALVTAAMLGHVDALRYLLSRGADVNAADGLGCTAVIGATQFGHLDVLDIVADAGADLDVLDARGLTALGAAAMGDPGVGSGAAPMLEPLKLLLSKGADPDLGDPEANPTIPATPLNLICNQLRQAAAMGNELETHEAAIAALLAHGADPEGRGPLVQSRPLHLVVGYSFASTKALLEAGADPNGRMYGQPHGNMTCLAVDDAADLGPRIRDIWAWGAANGEDASDKKTTIFATGTPLTTLLQVASCMGTEEYPIAACDLQDFDLLLQHGADPSAVGSATPLLFAMTFGDARTAEKLLAAGADPDHLLLLGPDQSFHSERGVLLRVDPSCQRRVRTRTFASVHFGAGDPMRAAFEAAGVDLPPQANQKRGWFSRAPPAPAVTAETKAIDAALAEEERMQGFESVVTDAARSEVHTVTHVDPRDLRLCHVIAHIRKQDPSVLARLDAHPAATEDAYVLPTESCPAPGTTARTVFVAHCSWRHALALQAQLDDPERRCIIQSRADFDRAVADPRFAIKADEWDAVERLLNSGNGMCVKMPPSGEPFEKFGNSVLDAPDVARASSRAAPDDEQLLGRCVAERFNAHAYTEKNVAEGGVRVPQAMLDILCKGEGDIQTGGTLLERWRTVGVDACVEINQLSGAPDNSSLSHVSAMTRSCWLRRAVRYRQGAVKF